jgi:hypothetical protein
MCEDQRRREFMITIFFAIIGLAAVIMLFRRNKAAFIAGVMVLFTLTYRIVDIAYLDLFGPVYAIELERYVGGDTATPMFVLSCLCFILPLWLLCRPLKMLRSVTGSVPDEKYHKGLTQVALAGCIVALVVVYGDMLRRGVIPLFVGMDRLEYNLISGIFHRGLYELNFLFSGILGVFTTLRRLQGRQFDLRFVVLLIALLAYWALTGNRASAFVVSICYFALPFAAVVAMERAGKLEAMASRDPWSVFVSRRVIVPVAMIASFALLVGLLINSYYDVRNYSDPLFQITQRVFIQPVQFWAATWSALDFSKDLLPSGDVFQQVVFAPLHRNANTTIQYLMIRELGYFRATELIAFGQQYAGGYPEIFFDLFGAWISLPMLLLFGIVTAATLRVATASLAKGKVLSAIMGIYIYYGFTLAYIGGMLNFLWAWTFVAKVLLLLLALWWEGAVLTRSVRSKNRSKKTKSFGVPGGPRVPPSSAVISTTN